MSTNTLLNLYRCTVERTVCITAWLFKSNAQELRRLQKVNTAQSVPGTDLFTIKGICTEATLTLQHLFSI